jgi:hypothetical protein
VTKLDGSEIDRREEFRNSGAHVTSQTMCVVVQLMASWRWERQRGLAAGTHVDDKAVLYVNEIIGKATPLLWMSG